MTCSKYEILSLLSQQTTRKPVNSHIKKAESRQFYAYLYKELLKHLINYQNCYDHTGPVLLHCICWI